MNTPKYSPERDFLDAMSVLVQKAIDVSTKIYGCVVVSVDTAQKIASVKINGKVNDAQYYGTAPTIGNVYRVFVPQNDMSRAFIITGESNGGGGGSVSPSTALPKMDGIASAGTSNLYSRGDHVHPHDSAKIDDPTTKSDGQALVYNGTAKKWEAKTLEAGGASVFLVTLTSSEYATGYHSDVTADKTFAEILAAYQSGYIVSAKWGNFSLRLVEIEEGASLYFSTFEGGTDVQVEIYNVTACCSPNNQWELGYYMNEIPFASDAIPKEPGTAKAGILGEFARGDHVHPKQTVTKSDVGLGNVDNVSVNTRLNRTTNVNAADTNYAKLMARGESLNAAEVTPAVNGAIAWVYG